MNDRNIEQFRLSGSVSLRPTRICFLVSPNDLRSVRQAIRLNTILWGGQFNPIIPVYGRGTNRWIEPYHKASGLDVTRGLVRFFEPEVVVESAPGLAAKVGWNAGENYQRERRLISMSEFASTDTYGRTQLKSGINIDDIYANLCQKDFKFEQRHKTECAIAGVTKDAFLDAVMGSFPIEKHLRFIEENYRNAFAPVDVPHNAETLGKILEGTLITPLWFTRDGLKRDYESKRGYVTTVWQF